MAKDFFESIDGVLNDLYRNFNAQSHFSGDPGLDKAWDELDSFMASSNAGSFNGELDEFDRQMRNLGFQPKDDPRRADAKAHAQAEARRQEEAERQRRSSSFHGSGRPLRRDEEAMVQLAKDYRNLEVEIGAPLDQVKSGYKKMLLKYHPDRFANDPAKQATATQITARLNESYARICDFLASRDR